MRLALALLLGAVLLGVIVSALSSVVGLFFWAAVVVGVVAGAAALMRRSADGSPAHDLTRRQHRQLEKKADRALSDLERRVGNP